MPLRAREPLPISIGPPPDAAHTGGIRLRLERQDEINWCWAACVEMVLKHFDVSDDEQCRIVQKALSSNVASITCCTSRETSNDNPNCDQPLDDEGITKLWTQTYGIQAESQRRTFKPGKTPLINELKATLDAGSPVELGYSGRKTGHVVILHGWEQIDDQLNFLVHDPSGGSIESIDALDIDRNELGTLDVTWKIPNLDA